MFFLALFYYGSIIEKIKALDLKSIPHYISTKDILMAIPYTNVQMNIPQFNTKSAIHDEYCLKEARNLKSSLSIPIGI